MTKNEKFSYFKPRRQALGGFCFAVLLLVIKMTIVYFQEYLQEEFMDHFNYLFGWLYSWMPKIYLLLLKLARSALRLILVYK